MSALTTRSPYLRNRLLLAVDGLRADAETARNQLDAARQDVAEAREILAEAEAQERRAQAEVDSIGRGIAWLEREAEHLAADPGDDPAAKLKATGLMREEPKQVADPGKLADQPEHTGGNAEDCPACRPQIDQPGGVLYPWHCPGNGDPDDLTAPGVADSRAQIAPHLPPPVPHEPPRIDTVHTSGTGAGQLVATSGPTVTMPDTGLNPDPLPPAPPTAEPRHAKPDRPGLLARLTGGHRTIRDEQDGDQADG